MLMDDAGFYLVPPLETRWQEYETLCQEQLGYVPRRTDKTVFVSHADHDACLVAGFTLVNTDGPYLFADGYVVSPALSPREKYNATVFCQHELKRACSILNRGAIALVTHKGLRTVLGNNGFERVNTELWVYTPTAVSEDPEFIPVRGSNVEPTYVEPTYVEDAPSSTPGQVVPAQASKKRGWPKGRKRGPRTKPDPQSPSNPA